MAARVEKLSVDLDTIPPLDNSRAFLDSAQRAFAVYEAEQQRPANFAFFLTHVYFKEAFRLDPETSFATAATLRARWPRRLFESTLYATPDKRLGKRRLFKLSRVLALEAERLETDLAGKCLDERGEYNPYELAEKAVDGRGKPIGKTATALPPPVSCPEITPLTEEHSVDIPERADTSQCVASGSPAEVSTPNANGPKSRSLFRGAMLYLLLLALLLMRGLWRNSL